MILPRRLMTYTDKDGKVCFCEEDDPKQEMNYHPKGYPIPDAEAERIGLKAYLDSTGFGDVAGDKRMTEAKAQKAVEVESKAVDQSEVEDKAVDGPQEKSPTRLSFPEKPAAEPAPEKTDEPGPGLHIDPELRRGRRS